MHTKWISFSIGLGLLFLLTMFVLLVNKHSTLTPLLPSRPIASSTQNATEQPGTSSSNPQVGIISPTLSITSTADTTVSNSALQGWQQFSSKTTGYTVFYPPHAKVSSFELFPGIIEQTQINFPETEQTYHMSVIIQIYENSSKRSVETFLAELYQNKYRKPITSAQRPALIQNTLAVAGTTGYQVDLLIGATDRQIIIPHKNYFYMFILMHAAGPIDSSPGEVEMFNRFMATVRLD